MCPLSVIAVPMGILQVVFVVGLRFNKCRLLNFQGNAVSHLMHAERYYINFANVVSKFYTSYLRQTYKNRLMFDKVITDNKWKFFYKIPLLHVHYYMSAIV